MTVWFLLNMLLMLLNLTNVLSNKNTVFILEYTGNTVWQTDLYLCYQHLQATGNTSDGKSSVTWSDGYILLQDKRPLGAGFYNNEKDNICSALFSESDPISKIQSFQVVYSLLLSTVASKPSSSFLCIFRAVISKGCDWKLVGSWEKEAKGYKLWNVFCALHFGIQHKNTEKTAWGKLLSYRKHVRGDTSSLFLLDSNYFYSKQNT